MSNQADQFWTFSLQIYAHESVAEACLSLQDNYSLDVNLILFCYWYGVTRGRLSGPTLRQALELAAPWKDAVVQPLRDIRRWMKTPGARQLATLAPGFDALREQIKRDELEAERYQQHMLQRLADSVHDGEAEPDSLAAVHHNLRALLSACGITRDERLDASLASIDRALAETD